MLKSLMFVGPFDVHIQDSGIIRSTLLCLVYARQRGVGDT